MVRSWLACKNAVELYVRVEQTYSVSDTLMMLAATVTAAERGPVIQTGEVDILSRNVTWTSSRDSQWGNFTITMFYDGQGYMVRADSGIESQADMAGASVCVTSGTTTEKNLAADFRERGLDFEAVTAPSSMVAAMSPQVTARSSPPSEPALITRMITSSCR
jgi:ABC-type amino acid transport substrate-binding protein